MRKIQIFGIALVAMCAFSALIGTQAFAVLTFELAQWLANGALIAEPLLSDAVGGLLFEDLLTSASFLCSGLLEGTVGPDSEDEITMVYDLSGRLIEELDEATATNGLVCENIKLCSKSEVWPVKLPWLTEVELDVETGLFYELTFGAQYNVLCEVLGMDKVELCVALEGTSGELLNVAGGVEAMGVAEPESTCNGEANMGLLEADAGNLITLTNGEPLTVSE